MLNREQVFKHTENCFNGQPASCTYACPFRLDIRSLLKKAAKGRLAAAAKELRGVMPFPLVVNTFCPRPCEKVCQRMTVMEEEPVSIGMILEACIKAPKKKERGTFKPPLSDKKVAVVGAGAVGLSFAYHMDVKRVRVTVFEKEEAWGGSLRSHPRFEEFNEDFTQVMSGTDVEFRFGEEIKSLDALDGYDAVFIATGKAGNLADDLEIKDINLGVTSLPKVFVGGEAAGLDIVTGLGRSLDAAKAVEAFIQSGDPFYGAAKYGDADTCRYAPHDGEEKKPHIVPAGDIYTPEEAQAEAERCMQCDCEHCMDACEFLAFFKKKPPRIAQDVAQDGMTRNSVSSASITRQTWSCLLCGRCNSMCREGADINGLFELSRRDRVESGNYPSAIHAYRMREFRLASGEASALIVPGEKCGYLFFPGCRLGGANPEYVVRSYDALKEKHPDTALMLNCCGVPALWAGEGEAFDRHIEFLHDRWIELGKPVIVYACASCRRIFSRFLPEIELVSLYELLDAGSAVFDKAAVFDPCAALGMDNMKKAVRSLASNAGTDVTDYDSDGKCCGFGGHMRLANQNLYSEITKNRCAETEEPFIVYCVNCAETFRAEGKKCAHILDSVFSLEPVPVLTLSEKRMNTLLTKKTVMEKFMNESFDIPVNEWDSLRLRIEPEVVQKMERVLIPADDVKETIWLCEKSGEGFLNENGDIICRHSGEYITCWVEYHQEGDDYVVTDVYSHRMKIREEQL